MGTTTRLTFDEYLRLPEKEGVRYELDEGTLVMEPSPTFRHNRIRDEIATRLREFVKANRLGEVTVETDFRLSTETVRRPDIAFVTPAQLKTIDIDRSPIEGAPALAIEVISASNLAQDTRKKVRQYLTAGCQMVWLVYPDLRLVEIHDAGGVREVLEPNSINEKTPFSGKKFSLSVAAIFDSEPHS